LLVVVEVEATRVAVVVQVDSALVPVYLLLLVLITQLL
jgi:hypothetical protein